MWPYLADETTWLDAAPRRRATADNAVPGALPGDDIVLSAEEIDALVARGRALRSRYMAECVRAGTLWLWRLPGRLASPARHRASLRPVEG
jgi:hypothetical protein